MVFPARLRSLIAATMCAGIPMAAPAADAFETITAGGVGAPQATLWPFYIGMDKGFFEAAGVRLDLVYAPSASAILQQLAGGSLDVVASAGLAEPVHAIDRGAPVAIARIVGRIAPYSILARPGIASFADLKGKIFANGGLADVSHLYWLRLLAATGVAAGDIDVIILGSTGARLAALRSHAVDATLLLPPLNFYAEAAGFHSIALVADYVKDLPFSGFEVSVPWAKAHGDAARRLLAAYDRSVAWFYDDANRREAIDILDRTVTMDQKNIVASYDYYRRIDFFARGSTVSRASLESMIEAMRAAGDIQGPLTAESLIMPGLTRLSE